MCSTEQILMKRKNRCLFSSEEIRKPKAEYTTEQLVKLAEIDTELSLSTRSKAYEETIPLVGRRWTTLSKRNYTIQSVHLVIPAGECDNPYDYDDFKNASMFYMEYNLFTHAMAVNMIIINNKIHKYPFIYNDTDSPPTIEIPIFVFDITNLGLPIELPSEFSVDGLISKSSMKIRGYENIPNDFLHILPHAKYRDSQYFLLTNYAELQYIKYPYEIRRGFKQPANILFLAVEVEAEDNVVDQFHLTKFEISCNSTSDYSDYIEFPIFKVENFYIVSFVPYIRCEEDLVGFDSDGIDDGIELHADLFIES